MTEGRGPVDREVIARLGLAACENAQELVDEAKDLSDAGHEARAFALTVLATEELAKGFVCMWARTAGDDPEDWETFWTIFGRRARHETKIAGTLFLERELLRMAGLPLDGLARELSDAVAGNLFAQKNRALYVDLDEDVIRTPLSIASDKEAIARAATLRKSVVAWSAAISLTLGQPPDAP